MASTEQRKVAFRSFEKEPRIFLGMEMVMLNMKIVLVLMLRNSGLEPAYPKDSRGAPDGFGGER